MSRQKDRFLFFSLFRRVEIDLFVQFCVEVEEGDFGLLIESVGAHLDGGHAVVEDRHCLDDVDQSSGRDDLVNTTVYECLADDVCPVDQLLDEGVVGYLYRCCYLLEERLRD